MESSTLPELVLLTCLIGISGILTLSHSALTYSSRQKLLKLVRDGYAGAPVALQLNDNIDNIVATLRMAVAFLMIIAAVLGGLTLTSKIEHLLESFKFAGPVDRLMSYSIAIFFITLLSLFIGDLLPRRLAMGKPEVFACALSGVMQLIYKLMSPILRVLMTLTEATLGLFGMHLPKEPVVTEEEVKELIEQGTQEGVFEKAEETIMKRALRLGDQKIGDIMTPRTHLVSLDLKDSWENNFRKMSDSPHSYFPVYRGNPEHITGLVSIKTLWSNLSQGQPISLDDCQIKPLFVMEKISALGVLELFKKSGKHIAIVVDEHGGLAGLLTVNDILQALVGDLPNSTEVEKPSAVQRQDGSWLIDGMISIDEFKELFKLDSLPEDQDGTYQTLAGFVMFQMGRVPRESDYFVAKGLTFEVVDMDGKRIDKVLVSVTSKATKKARNQQPRAH